MAEGITLAAIDAGSNAIRASVVVATSATEFAPVVTERMPVRLGHGAFSLGEIDEKTLDEAVTAFARFKTLFEQHGVARYRAVATSAAREARNRYMLLRRIDHETGIELEVIDGEEEARLSRRAILNAFRGRSTPNLLLDLGGGSLEVEIRRGDHWDAASLQVGTVRLLETLGLEGAISKDEAEMVRRNTATILHSFVPTAIGTPVTPAVASGGNAEALASILARTDEQGTPVIDFEDLERELPAMLAMSIQERMEHYGVKADRAEVMGAAALVIATVGEELRLRRLLVPGVGVREGILLDLAEEVVPGAVSRDHALLAEARAFGHRLGHDLAHGEHVRKVARALFDQLGKLHELPEDRAVLLELAALLHDIGEVLHRRGHHRHGEYIIRWARIPGLESPEREMVAAVVRLHRKGTPDGKKHQSYGALGKNEQQDTRRLAALLRLADSIDTDRRQRVTGVRATIEGETVCLDLTSTDAGRGLAEMALRKTDFFEKEFSCDVVCTVNGGEVAASAPPRADP